MKKVLIASIVLLTGCPQPTSFKGDAHFPGGPNACFEMCKSGGMEMDSYIFVGEYSSGCVCRPVRISGQQTSSQSRAGSTAAAAGVIAQTRIEEERRQAAASQQRRQQSQ
ncbi:MAG: hypothetical protein JKY56_26565 [Kofleriaceae bacterium]|nr:hypothetical protein [Kofleriaceae bacterium]